jgi:SSS family solute:Na+ symporter
MTLLFLCGITIYFVTMAVIGYNASRKVTSMSDYLAAKRRLPLYLAVPTVVATWFGAGVSMGISGVVYSQGFYGVIADPIGCAIALAIAGIFYAGRFRRLGILTISDLLGRAYGTRFERFSTIVVIPFYIGTIASQLLAMGYVFQLVSGASLEIGILIGAVIVVTYTVSGGIWAVTITDFIQFFLLSIGLAIVVPICLNTVPDTEALFNKFFSEFSTMAPYGHEPFNWPAYIGRILMTGLGTIMGQDLIQRFLASKTEKVARWSGIIGGLCYFLLGLIPMFIGIAGREIYLQLEQPEHLIPLLAKEYLPPLVFTLFACGLFSAIMSTADSYLLAGTTLITNNILLKIWPQTPERSKLTLLRWVNIAVALVALGLSLSGQSIFDMIVHSGTTLFVGIFVPASMALFWKGANTPSAWASMLIGIATWLGFFFLNSGNYLGRHEDLLFSAAFFGALGSLLSYGTVSLIRHMIKTAAAREGKLPEESPGVR